MLRRVVPRLLASTPARAALSTSSIRTALSRNLSQLPTKNLTEKAPENLRPVAKKAVNEFEVGGHPETWEVEKANKMAKELEIASKSRVEGFSSASPRTEFVIDEDTHALPVFRNF